MKIELLKHKEITEDENTLFLVSLENFKNLPLSKIELDYIDQNIQSDIDYIEINHYTNKLFVQIVRDDSFGSQECEKLRKLAFLVHEKLQEAKISKLIVQDYVANSDAILSFTEGLSLSNYQFLKYFSDKEKKKYSLEEVGIQSDLIGQDQIDELNAVVEGVKFARELVDEPLSYLTAKKLSEEIEIKGKETGISVEVFEKAKIESLKMGGLLAVNKGSLDTPTFTIMEWKPEGALNSKPIVFVGKGVVYDTGGLSLKPTKGSMDLMKSDMGGAASVAGAIYSIAKAKLPVHVIGLIPATDNRPGGNAYVPGDVVNMYNGKTVEVLNTDAEGRMLLADALSYAEQYQPEFVVDLATLTGAAAVAIGKYGIVGMGNKESEKQMNQLKESGNKVYERVVEFPFWDEFGELIKSDIADIKNIGGRDGGAITAGKFLEHFTNYPWIHLDIAGPAYLETNDSYRGKGGTGIGVRLLFDFIKSYQS